jgi:hypothetical protein
MMGSVVVDEAHEEGGACTLGMLSMAGKGEGDDDAVDGGRGIQLSDMAVLSHLIVSHSELLGMQICCW